jgi:hypothetical protein
LPLAAEFEGRDGGNDNDVDDEFDDDAEAVKGMARLFCEVAEAYIQLILAATPQVNMPLQLARVIVLVSRWCLCWMRSAVVSESMLATWFKSW